MSEGYKPSKEAWKQQMTEGQTPSAKPRIPCKYDIPEQTADPKSKQGEGGYQFKKILPREPFKVKVEK